jgi:hypothetical protein
MKKVILKRSAMAMAVSTVFFLTACGGGGGGGGGGGSPGNPSPSLLRQVPYAMPTRVGSITPVNSTTYESDSSSMFSANLSGSGQQVITAGRSSTTNQGSYPTYNLNVFGWSNGTLVNQTAQWFHGTDNQILGTEPSVKFADFNGDGRLDMFVSPNTDSGGLTGSGWAFLNTGSSFSRVNLNLNVNGHDSAVYDLNGDGYADIITTGNNVSFGSAAGTFTNYGVGAKWVPGGLNYPGSAGSVAIADFMGNGGSSIIFTDQNNFQTGGTRLYSWSIDNTLNQVQLSTISVLPDGRFLLPKWSNYGFVGTHEQRALAFDFDNSGLTSAVIFSQPVGVGGTWPQYSEIQFLKNHGGGVFTDVTDTTLVGYNTSTPPNYTPQLLDMNGDGLVDIVLGSTSWTSATGAQVLVHTKEQKYVASYATVLDSFVGQALDLEKAINASATNGANGIVFVKGPDGNIYLATAVSYTASGVQQKAIYLSKLGATTVSAQATAANIKQIWPWMSDGQVNTVLAQSSTQWFGINLLDPTQAMNPTGELQISVAGRGLQPIRGYLMGLDMGDGQSVLTDTVGRTYYANLKSMNVSGLNSFGYNTEHIDQYNLTSHAEYLVNGTPVTYGNMRIATENRNSITGSNDQGPGLLNKPTQYSIGIPEAYKNGKFSYGMQYTNLNSNPWIAFGGSWGMVTNSGILDNVVTYRDGGFSAQASFMNVTTNITPGLITKVNNMNGAWGESGYRYYNEDFGDLGIFAGVKPVVLNGSVEAKLPTGVDNNGNTLYTTKNLMVQNQITPYVRALYTNMLDRNTQYRFSAMTTTTNGSNQYRIMNEFRFFFD